jgi:Tfp pilus assembly protein PilF
MSQKLETLRSLVAQDPGNSRFRYMLGMELLNSGNPGGAVAAFEELMAADPTYSAAYFHCGQAYEKLGRVEDARDVYRKGIDATTKNGDMHTRSELQGVLDLLG